MPSRSLFKSPAGLLLAVVFLAVALSLRDRMGRSGSTEAGPPPPGCEGLTPDECRARMALEGDDGTGASEEVVLAADEACRNVGYLCAEVTRVGRLQLLRWPEDTPLIRIWVPEPTGISPGAARALQNAAAQGIRAWDGHPFPLSVRTRSQGEEPDITVRWVPSLGGQRLGRAQLMWTREGEVIGIEIQALTLVTHYPSRPDLEMTPEQIRLVAAHEMGHALGLPHSDDSRDLMYPQNTATSPSAEDYRTLQALYALPNGAEIRR